ncbi:metallophosphoesterase [Flavobacterium sp. AS60]|uniref:metallophosphoesterase family protein n=1 Tax=Flavobacterium anseongense TaxID=2910677 RepID=UPI001F36F165|nr:metallophosphoesterase [Flavobacterium sp. AS60]MCF6129904.1 metallophosphoesterase [Flavobacterium sp. AS60]
MKIIIFGDVHGNLIALEKLFEIEKSQTDLFVCHGDVVNYGPWTNDCINYLKDIPNCTLLKGNHEKYFIDGSYDGTNNIAQTFFRHCYQNFDKTLIKEIRGYGMQTQVEDYTVQHTIGNQYIFADTDMSQINIDKNYIIGHSHQQFFRVKDNFKLYNTGSIGQNRQNINQSCYLKYDSNTKKIELKSYLHDIDKVINQMKTEKYPQLCIDYYLSKGRL